MYVCVCLCDMHKGRVREREFCQKIGEKYVSGCFDHEMQGEKSVMRPTEKVMHAILTTKLLHRSDRDIR